MKPPPLPLLHMTRQELAGILFCEFPADWTLDRSRLALESLVRRCGELTLSPATIYMAFSEERRRNFTRLPKEARERKMAATWAARHPPQPPPKPLPKINPEEWSF